jgi:hypothetical protein
MLAVWQSAIVDAAGNIKPGAQVRVTEAGTSTLATLKPNRDGSGSLGNPFAADSEGFAKFYVAQGRYDIRVTFSGYSRTLVDVCLFEDTTLTGSVPVYQLVTPAAGSANNYSPAGFTSDTTFLDLVPGAGNASLTGMMPTNGWRDGQRFKMRNGHASNTVTLVAESASSTAANRFSLGYDLTLSPGVTVEAEYISAISRIVVCP